MGGPNCHFFTIRTIRATDKMDMHFTRFPPGFSARVLLFLLSTSRLCCKNDAGLVNSAVFEKSRGVSFVSNQSPFKWRHFEAEIILLCVRWYQRYALSYRDLEEMMRERGSACRSHDHLSLSSNGMLPNWRSAAVPTSKPPMTPGAWMKRTSKSKRPGPISTEPSIRRETQGSSCSVRHETPRPLNASSSKPCTCLPVQLLKPVRSMNKPLSPS